MKITIIIVSVLSIAGLVLTWFSGWFINTHTGKIAAFARSFDIHGVQAISTAILTIIILVYVIAKEFKKEKNLGNG